MSFPRKKILAHGVAAVMAARVLALCLCHVEACGEGDCVATETRGAGWQAEHGRHGQHECAVEALPEASVSWQAGRLATGVPVFALDVRTGVWKLEEARRLKPLPPEKPPPGLVLKKISHILC